MIGYNSTLIIFYFWTEITYISINMKNSRKEFNNKTRTV